MEKIIKKILLYLPLFLICFSIKNVYAISSGKNLLPLTNQDFTFKNVRYYVNNGSLYLDGTSTGETFRTASVFKDNFSFYLDAGTYTFSMKHITTVSGDRVPVYLTIYDDDTALSTLNGYNVMKNTFTLTERTNLYIGFYIYQKTFNNLGLELQIEKGSQATEYEPFIPPEPEPEPEIPVYNFDNNKYYVPNYIEGQCVEILDKDTIRVFNDENTSFYIDYYINSNYISRQGQVDLNYLKNCSNLQFTDIRYYGNDFPQILIILSCFVLFSVGFPYILYKRFRKR